MKSGCSTYKKINTMGMSQLDLILVVYRGTIGYLEEAKAAILEEKYDIGRTACDKARNCIVHLYTTLDMEKGKEIASYLGSLYAYSIEQLDLALATKSIEKFDDIIGVMTNLKEGWEALRDKQGTVQAADVNKSAGDEPPSEEAKTTPVSPTRRQITLSA